VRFYFRRNASGPAGGRRRGLLRFGLGPLLRHGTRLRGAWTPVR